MTGPELLAWLAVRRITNPQLAAMLGVSQPTIWRWCHLSSPPAFLPLALETLDRRTADERARRKQSLQVVR